MRRLLTLLSTLLLGFPGMYGAWATPTVVMTSPPQGATISEKYSPTVLLQATATDSVAPIYGVAFYVCMTNGTTCTENAYLAGSVLTAPYQFAWKPPTILAQGSATQSYIVFAQAENTLGFAANSNSVTFTVFQPPHSPSITLVAPLREVRYVTPAAPVFYVTATPADTQPPSSVAKVDFLDGETVIGTVTASNATPAGSGYAFVWNNPPLGGHVIYARVTDTFGDTALPIDGVTGNTVSVSVIIDAANPSPQVSLLTPTTGQTFNAAGSVPLSVNASSLQATITRVEYVAGDVVIAAPTAPPFNASWTNPAVGDFTLVAKAYDNVGYVTASAPAFVRILDSRPPAVVMTGPSPGASVLASAALTLTATALSPDSSIDHVDFYAGAAKIGTATTAPYQFLWATPSGGPLSLTATAVDARGVSGTSTAVGITVTGSAPPTVTLTSPTNGATYTAPATIPLAANATAVGGSVAKVEFFNGATKIGTATTAPYTASWTSVAAGSYSITAKVTDNLNATATSAGASVTVTAPPPTIVLTSPTAGTTYALGQSVLLTAQATSPQTTLSRIEFYSDATLISTTPVAGGVSSVTANLTWPATGAGPHALSAKVFTAVGGTATSASVNISVSDLAVTLIQPYTGQVFQVGTPVVITANPTESSGSINHVEFYADGSLIGSTPASPYQVVWSGAAAGSHSISAKVFDVSGLSTNSATASINVLSSPTLQVNSGIDGSSVNDDNLSVSGNVQASLNSAVVVNGQAAALDVNGNFVIDGVVLLPGANTLTLMLNTADGGTITKTITVTSTGTKPFQVDLDKQQGLAPLTVNLTIRNRSGVAFQRIEVDANDDGTPETVLNSLTNGSATVAITYPTAGLRTIRVTVYDASNNIIYKATRQVLAIDPAQFFNIVTSVYVGIVSSLRANNVNAALNGFVGDSRAKYLAIFNALGSSLPSVAAQLGTVTSAVVMEDFAELTLVRPTGNGGQSFLIHLIKGDDGIWRAETM